MYEDIKVGTGDSPKDGQQVLPPKQRFYFLLLILLISTILVVLDMNKINYIYYLIWFV